MYYHNWQKYKQKPRQYGPLSYVRYSVRENAERLGIDYNHIKLMIPYMEGAGSNLMLINKKVEISGSDHEWGTSGFLNKSTNSNYIATGVNDNELLYHTIVLQVEKRSAATTKYLLDSSDGSTGLGIRFGTTGTLEYFAYASGGAGLCASPVISVGQTINVALVHSAANNRLFFNGHLYSTGSVSGTLNNLSTQVIVGADYNLANNVDALYKNLIIFDSVLPEHKILQFHETPYALIMPVSRPFYMDFGAGGSGSITAVTLSTQPTLILSSLTGSSAGSVASVSVSSQPSLSLSTLVGNQTGTIASLSESAQPVISIGSLTGLTDGIVSAVTLSTQPGMSIDSLTGSGAGVVAALQLSAQPSLTISTLSGEQDGTLSAVQISTQPVTSIPSLTGEQTGGITSVQLSCQPVASLGAITGLADGILTAIQASAQPVISLSALTGSGVGAIASSQLSTTPVINVSAITGAQTGSIATVQNSSQPVIGLGNIVGLQGGYLNSLLLSLQPGVSLSTITGEQDGAIGYLQFSTQPLFALGDVLGESGTPAVPVALLMAEGRRFVQYAEAREFIQYAEVKQ